jgi:prevent-host-death family protein
LKRGFWSDTLIWSLFLVTTMADTISTVEAKARFSELIDRAAAGEEIVVTRSGKPRARIVPLADPPKRPYGLMKDRWKPVSDEILLAPASEEDIRWAEGYYQSNGLYYTKVDLKRASKASSKKQAPNRRKRSRGK